jgi:PIN domain nuclease of toxin-antitoxin system
MRIHGKSGLDEIRKGRPDMKTGESGAGSYKSPFNRMLIAQGQLEKMPIVTSDAVFNEYDVSVIW